MVSSIQSYSVVITNSNYPGGGTPPHDGFMDNERIEAYAAASGDPNPLEMSNTLNLTLALCTAKRRANIRFQEMIRQFELVQNCWIDPLSITATNATALVEPSQISFNLTAYFGDSAWSTPDELNAGVFLLGTDCIARCIARALTADLFRVVDIFDPTATTSPGNATTNVIRYGTRIGVATEIAAHVTGALSSSLPAAQALATITRIPA